MTSRRFNSSRPHESIEPRPHTDAHQRYRTYGPIRPMDEDRLPLGGILRTPAWRAILLALAAFWAGVAWLAWSWIDG